MTPAEDGMFIHPFIRKDGGEKPKKGNVKFLYDSFY
jgi:hypothetical protein